MDTNVVLDVTACHINFGPVSDNADGTTIGAVLLNCSGADCSLCTAIIDNCTRGVCKFQSFNLFLDIICRFLSIRISYIVGYIVLGNYSVGNIEYCICSVSNNRCYPFKSSIRCICCKLLKSCTVKSSCSA